MGTMRVFFDFWELESWEGYWKMSRIEARKIVPEKYSGIRKVCRFFGREDVDIFFIGLI